MTYAKLLLWVLFFSVLHVHVISEEDEVDPVMKRTVPAYALALGENLLDSTQCRKDLHEFRTAIDRRMLWSLKMLDASGVPRPGFVYGNNYWLGIKSQCNDVTNRVPLILYEKEQLNNSKYRNPDEEFPPFEPNYFVAHFRHNSTLQYHIRLFTEDVVTLGLCLPASCTTSEIGLLLERMFRDRTLEIGERYPADFNLVEVKDLQGNHQWFRNGKMIFITCALVVTCILMSIGTAYDVLVHQKHLRAKRKLTTHETNDTTLTVDDTEAEAPSNFQDNSIGQILLCFSAYSNAKIILNTKLSSKSIPEFHGMKLIAIISVISLHISWYTLDTTDKFVYRLRTMKFMDNKPQLCRSTDGFAFLILINAIFAVDTFFFISGFLMVYTYLDANTDRKNHRRVSGTAKVAQFFIRVLKRYIRLTPTYIVAIGITELISTWHQETSQFYLTDKYYDVCSKYWWRNILYINNLFSQESICMTWSWYLSNDMQFFIVGTLLVTLSSTHFLTTAVLLCALLSTSIVVTGYMSYIHNFMPTIDQTFNLIDIVYTPPWARIGPYLIGMVTAHVIMKVSNKLHLKKKTVAICWCCGGCCILFVLFGALEKRISILAAAFYIALSRTVWAVGLGWIIVACQMNHGGIVHRILSLKVWIPFSNLTYCAYLLNPLLISSVYLRNETSAHVDLLAMMIMAIGFVVCTYLCAFALSLMTEQPYILLVRKLKLPEARKTSPSRAVEKILL